MICAWMLTSSAETGSSATMKLRLQDEGARDPDPLALAAARTRAGSGRAQCAAARRAPSLLCPPRRRAGRSPILWTRSGSAMHRADRHARVQRRVGVLEDHLHPAAHRLQRIRP